MGRNDLRKRLGNDGWKTYQRKRMVLKVLIWRRKTKERLVKSRGGKCERCGYDKPIYAVYEFHHTDPSKKEFSVSRRGRTCSVAKMQAEVAKCLLLCARCHRELHALEDERNANRDIAERREEIERIRKKA